MKKKSLLAGAAAAALSFAGQAALADGPVAAFYGSISPFYGTINPFYGTINPFYGTINPFYGSISPFYGTINPFWGNIAPFWGQINPFYGSISPFYGTINPFWGTINPFTTNQFFSKIAPFWATAGSAWDGLAYKWSALGPYSIWNASQYQALRDQFQSFYDTGRAAWDAQIKLLGGAGFDAVTAPVLARYGIDLNNPSSFGSFNNEKRARLIIDYYDTLMNFSGADRVDHWMGTIKWSPSMTQDVSQGAATTIGLLDASIAAGTEMYGNIEYAGGYTTYSNDHGAAVASLIFAQHDGKGAMGMAPNAKVINYNPFDATGTASFADVRSGVLALASRGANIVNMSLGVPGKTLDQGIADILTDSTVTNQLRNTVFVVSAGNDGLAQTQNLVAGSQGVTSNYILVGSVRLDKTISPWSNTPGTACLIVAGVCQDQNRLMNHFIVAPGELLLVSDNHGGLVRQTGTSFAAPLVSGTITLMFNRWPWLETHPQETVKMVLESATDLGAPGVDPVYGWGLLNVEGALSPLKYDNLVVYQSTANKRMSAAELKGMILTPGQLGTWETLGAWLYVFENVGSTYRDFAVPLSTKLYGTDMNRNGVTARFQRYMYTRLITWANTTSLTDIQRFAAPESEAGGWKFAAVATAVDTYTTQTSELGLSPGYVFRNPSAGIGLQFGYGAGMTAFAARDGFGLYSDYSATSGGVNPILGFASGGAYAGGSLQIAKGVAFSFGYTEQHEADVVTTDLTKINPYASTSRPPGVAAYAASATVVSLALRPSKWLTLDTTYTQLQEGTGLLGVQGAGALSLAGGATTDAITFDTESRLGAGYSFSTSATVASTRPTSFASSSLAVSEALRSTAFALALNKVGVARKNDAIRVSLTQPLHIESGALGYTSYQVTDRSTGELGLVTDTWKVTNGERQLLAELMYATPLLDGAAQLSVAGQQNLASERTPGTDEYSLSSRVSFRF